MKNNLQFVCNIPTKVYFGEDLLGNLGGELKRFGGRVLLVYGGGSIKKTGLYDRVTDEVKKAGIKLFELGGIEPNPRITSVDKGAAVCKKEKIDAVLAVGGGSVIDAAKIIAAGAFYGGGAWDIMTDKTKITNALPLITVLTLSATGSEMNGNAVISNLMTQDKLGTGSPLLVPKVSFLDPSNTFSVGAYQTACGAADILSHIFEQYFNLDGEFEMTDSCAEAIMRTVIKYAPIAVEEPNNFEARANLMWASSWALNGFLNSGSEIDWTCHPIEHELSAIYDITHGLGLAIVTPRWMEYCLNKNTEHRFARFARNVFGINQNDNQKAAKEGIAALSRFLFDTLKLNKTLTEINIDAKNIPLMAKKACAGDKLNGFVPLTIKDVETILKNCL